jgi:hypothetical protein
MKGRGTMAGTAVVNGNQSTGRLLNKKNLLLAVAFVILIVLGIVNIITLQANKPTASEQMFKTIEIANVINSSAEFTVITEDYATGKISKEYLQERYKYIVMYLDSVKDTDKLKQVLSEATSSLGSIDNPKDFYNSLITKFNEAAVDYQKRSGDKSGAKVLLIPLPELISPEEMEILQLGSKPPAGAIIEPPVLTK